MTTTSSAGGDALRILFAASELYPLVKTGGLADFAYGLPRALSRAGHAVTILVPGYRSLLTRLKKTKVLATLAPADNGGIATQIIESRIPGTSQKLWVVDAPTLFDRDGRPYTDEHGQDWPDNARRFAHFCRVGAALASGAIDLNWRADIVHCNDWQTGLLPAFLKESASAPRSVFTVHNLAYQGNYSGATFADLQLPWHWWSFDKIEFHDQMSFIKGGLSFADRITTVSPRYAQEIMSPPLSCGLEGVLNYRRAEVSGILNGVDYKTWNPSSDPYLRSTYRKNQFGRKAANKTAFFEEHQFDADPAQPLFGFIGRLVYQKGIHLLLDAMDDSARQGAAWAILGSGDPEHEQALQTLARRYPGQIAVHIGYDEAHAHRIEAAADMFVMPSLYEPCGLNQLYSLRYGTIPVVSDTGGLSDSVIDTDSDTLQQGSATGFVFPPDNPLALRETLDRARALFADKEQWQQLQKNAMAADFSWDRSARHYLALYRELGTATHRPLRRTG